MSAASLAKHLAVVEQQKNSQPRIKYRKQSTGSLLSDLQVGDTISIKRDEEGESLWEREEARGFDDCELKKKITEAEKSWMFYGITGLWRPFAD
ncbi:hypothetical protein VHEMI10453 [[Torrubiella] hemipterigena]|uniref:Uncharacterized protein n=1 Tax=[Torrubiella] hemipterigena TaxID=1531966 RepID=A0A0A1TIS6_9HYPO|nr:hypothetical protein VHEMI10453 [[Torrubiella] hemipterigena]